MNPFEQKDPGGPIGKRSGDSIDAAMSIAFGSSAASERLAEDGLDTQVGRYRLLEQIGEGGFGVVYMAEQRDPIRRRVALKIIKLGMDTKQVIARFEAERQALAMMNHENIAAVLDAGATEAGRPYFVMELVRGVPITEFCDRNKLNPLERLSLFVSVCNAVQHAHQKGIIHRDLKPSNVMVTLRDGVPVPKVIDFGVAKATQARLTEKTIFTQYGQFIGTPAYMSPEQVEMSELDVDTRSDIYALGVLLYELLTGNTPIERERLQQASYSDMQRMICELDPPKPSSRLSRTDEKSASISAQRSTDPKKLSQIMRGELDWIVMKALEKDRNRRYATANGLAADVTRYLNNEPVEASPASTTYKLRRFARKQRKLIAAATAFTLLLVTGTLISTWLAFLAMKAESRALHNEALAKERLHHEMIAQAEMKSQRDLAERLGVNLKNQLEATDRAAERSRHLLYVAHMNLIQRELETGNDPRIIELLNHHRPADGQRDLRGFEWYYAWGLSNRHPWTWRHHASVTSVAYSPSGETVVSGCSDGRLQVWDTESGQIISAVNGHGNIVFDIAFSRDGRLLATGSADLSAKLWTFESGRLDYTGDILHCNTAVRRLALSPDGNHLAVCSDTGELRLWDLRSGVQQDITAAAPAHAVAFGRDGATLAAGEARFVRLVDVHTASVTRTIETTLPAILSLAYSPTDDTLALGDGAGPVELWSEETGIQRLGQHSGGVSDLDFSADGQVLASAGYANRIMLWSVDRGDQADVLRGHDSTVHSIAFAPDGRALASASEDHTVKLWDLTRGQAAISLADHDAPVGSLAFSPASRNRMASGSRDGTVKLWDVDEGKVMEALPAYGDIVRCVAISPSGETIAYAGGVDDAPANLFFWDTRRRTLRRTAREHSRAVLAVAFSPDGETLASGGDEGLVILWDVATGTSKAELESNTGAILSVAYSPDGRFLATGAFHHNAITIWDVEEFDKRRALEGHQDWVTSVAFSPAGNALASGSVDRTVRIWDVAEGVEKLALTGHSGRVESVVFSPDGSTLASIGRDDQLRLWDVATGQEKSNLDCQPRTAGLAVAFSRDGRSLATVAGDSVVVYRAARDEDFFFHDQPEVPRNHLPTSNSVVHEAPVRLEAIPFFHQHSDVEHRASHWQVRTAEGTYTTPVVNHVGTQDLTALSLERGIVIPDTVYFWRVAYTGSNRRTTTFSSETSFTTGDFPFQAVPFDLTSHFDRDIIKNPADSETDSIDASAGSHLIVQGFDGTRLDNPRVDGLPADRRIGLHVLGDYSGKNAIQTSLTDRDKAPIRISVPPDIYDFVRFLVVGGNGNSDMPVRFEYQDGTAQREVIPCDDWFHDIAQNRYGMLREGLLPIINEMDRFYEHEFRDDNAAAIFEFMVQVDSAKKLLAFVLEIDSEDAQYTDTALWPDHARARFNLLAATGVRVGP